VGVEKSVFQKDHFKMQNQSKINEKRMKVAVIGSGISGISCAWALKKTHDVTLFDSSRLGGHTNTVDIKAVDGSGSTIGVDTGFIVCNPVTYPNFLRFLDELGVELGDSSMSFAVSRNRGDFEWAGKGLDSLFCQRVNLCNLNVYRMVYDIVRFNRHATRIAEEADRIYYNQDGTMKENVDHKLIQEHPLSLLTLGQFFEKEGYSSFFYENYVLPMTSAIWSSPADLAFEKFPVLTLIRFMRNHCLLQLGKRPVWRTVVGGSRNYIAPALDGIENIYTNTRIVKVKRPVDVTLPVEIWDQNGQIYEFDHLIIAAHSDEALRILGTDATEKEREILGKIKYSRNIAYLHRDEDLMPVNKKAWSSWNYLTTAKTEKKSENMCLTYWMNRLQSIIDHQVYGQVFVTLNPLWKPKPKLTLKTIEYEHPVYSVDVLLTNLDN
jgi:uncharacterized protein